MNQSELSDLIDNSQLPGIYLILDNENLSGLSLKEADLRGAHFYRCNMAATNFTRSNLKGARFTDCILDDSLFEETLMDGAVIRECRLNRANMIKITATGLTLTHSTATKPTITECDFKRPDLQETLFKGAKIKNLRLIDPNLGHFTIEHSKVFTLEINQTGPAIEYSYHFAVRHSSLTIIKFTDLTLYDADFSGSTFDHAVMAYCKFVRPNLAFTAMHRVTANTCQFIEAVMSGASVHDSPDLSDQLYDQQTIVPQGAIIGYKALSDNLIAKLLIPKTAKRSSSGGRKCRASKAKVISITDQNGLPCYRGHSAHNPAFIYEEGKTVRPTKEFDQEKWEECTHGIHFFITEREAREYMR